MWTSGKGCNKHTEGIDRFILFDGKDRIDQAYETIKEQMWSFDDLKVMADTNSDLYKLVIAEGIPDGLARRFKKDLKAFKSFIRVVGALSTLSNPAQ
jgi:hypothetical protein